MNLVNTRASLDWIRIGSAAERPDASNYKLRRSEAMRASWRRFTHGENAAAELTLCVIAYVHRRRVCSRGILHACRVRLAISESLTVSRAARFLCVGFSSSFASLSLLVLKSSHLGAERCCEKLRLASGSPFLNALLSANCCTEPDAFKQNSEVANKRCLQPSAWNGRVRRPCLPSVCSAGSICK